MNTNLQKGRTTLLTLLQQLDQQQDDLTREVSFRDKDILILRQQCQTQYDIFTRLIQQKQAQRRQILQLKEQLCELNPEALEEMERDCEKNQVSEEVVKQKQQQSRPIKKKNDKKKRRKDHRIYYD